MKTRMSGDGRVLQYDWVNVIFLSLTHLLAVIGLLHFAIYGWSWAAIIISLVMFSASGFAITGGYHRWGAHGAYQAAKPLQAIFLFFGAGALQQSLIQWNAEHIPHHLFEGTTKDRYNFKNGFWWAHFRCWLYKFDTNYDQSRIKELKKNKLVLFQHNHLLPLAIIAGFVLPIGLATYFGDFWGGFFGNFLRLAVLYNATWSVNSVSHYLGTRPYRSKAGKIMSLATRFMINALTSGGEGGDHAFHHRFMKDYRAGREWTNFDPTKWIIFTLSKIPFFPLTWDLCRADDREINESMTAKVNQS